VVVATVRFFVLVTRQRATVRRALLLCDVDFAATDRCVDAAGCARFRLCVAAEAWNATRSVANKLNVRTCQKRLI